MPCPKSDETGRRVIAHTMASRTISAGATNPRGNPGRIAREVVELPMGHCGPEGKPHGGGGGNFFVFLPHGRWWCESGRPYNKRTKHSIGRS